MTNDNQKSDVRFVVTGFGPFQGVPSNPTTVLVEKLIDFLAHHENSAVLKSLATTTRTLVLETAVEDVETQLEHLFDETVAEYQESDENEGESDVVNRMTILLHLGVNYCGRKFQIESCAYNNANFGVADERGYRPTKVPICSKYNLETCLETALNVSQLMRAVVNCKQSDNQRRDSQHNKQQIDNQNDTVKISTDPGRFVCNYTYFYSMNKFGCCKFMNESECPPATHDKTRCLFLHVPPFGIIPETEQLHFLGRLMEAIYEQVTMS